MYQIISKEITHSVCHNQDVNKKSGVFAGNMSLKIQRQFHSPLQILKTSCTFLFILIIDYSRHDSVVIYFVN